MLINTWLGELNSIMALNDLSAVVVDDSDYSRPLIETVTRMAGFQVSSFSCPLEALHYVRENPIDMVFTDFRMPKMDGLTFMRETRKVHHDIPVVMITGDSNAPELKDLAPEDSFSELFAKPFSPEDFFERVKPLALRRQYMKFAGAYRLKEDVFGNHRVRVGLYSKIIAAGLNWDEREQDLIYYAAQLHDIGMISIPDHIFFKPGPLTHDEMDIVRKHCSIGCSIMPEKSNPYFTTASIVSLTHHERYNGSGYPSGLSGDAISVYGRVTAVADVFDVLTSTRPYKTAWDFEKSLSFISDNMDIHFDPVMAAVFVRNADRINEIYASLAD